MYTRLGVPNPETDLKAPLDGYNAKYAAAKAAAPPHYPLLTANCPKTQRNSP
jgi:hypothetical protein